MSIVSISVKLICPRIKYTNSDMYALKTVIREANRFFAIYIYTECDL